MSMLTEYLFYTIYIMVYVAICTKCNTYRKQSLGDFNVARSLFYLYNHALVDIISP